MTRVFNINPNKTRVNGSCTAQLVTLELRDEDVTLLVFHFGMVRAHVPLSLGGFRVSPAWRLSVRLTWFSFDCFLVRLVPCGHSGEAEYVVHKPG